MKFDNFIDAKLPFINNDLFFVLFKIIYTRKCLISPVSLFDGTY